MSKNLILDDKYYTDAPPEVDEAFDRSVRVSADFLPPPSEIAKMKRVITIRLDGDSVDFFKQEAKKNGTQYQTMINDLLREYVNKHKQAV